MTVGTVVVLDDVDSVCPAHHTNVDLDRIALAVETSLGNVVGRCDVCLSTLFFFRYLGFGREPVAEGLCTWRSMMAAAEEVHAFFLI